MLTQTTSAIIGVITLAAGGTMAYSDVVTDVAVNATEIQKNEERQQERHSDIKEDLRDIRELLNEIAQNQ